MAKLTKKQKMLNEKLDAEKLYGVDEALQTLIAAIDERIVSTADPYREDLVVTVWRGEQVGVFSDEGDGEDEDDESDEGAGDDDE